ncbi:hypothetical protein L3X38_002818 [Prunus dulcis]|uniref:Uncharacterized protein n=1 Tax=Prunus dulcis TaxID=3755 RepID=A0AAD4ZKD1_PRUDU|nr:hypothetical protein L3X38_002818 [Prunus dulcis]
MAWTSELVRGTFFRGFSLPSIPKNSQNVPIQSAPDIANPLGKLTTQFWSGSKPTVFLLPQLSFPTSFLGLGQSNWPNSSGSDVVLRGVERPNMKQVAMELEEITSKGRHPAAGKANYFTSPKDTDNLLGSPVYIVDLEGNVGGSSGIITSADYDKSLPTQIQMNEHYDNGR